jgi:hypoxanthine phosphoribosyltransferase
MIYTTDSFCEDCKLLAERVSGYPFTHILSVERGGGYVTRELIKYYPKAIVVPIRVSFYDGQIKRNTPIIEYASGKVFNKNDKVLIVDELTESGDSLILIKQLNILINASDVKIAVLIKKIKSKIDPDYFLRDNINDWCKFPWEDEFGNHIS